MIVVNAAMRSDEIVEAVLKMEGKNFKFLKKVGLKHYFESDNEAVDGPDIKKMLKATPRFAALYTAVSVE